MNLLSQIKDGIYQTTKNHPDGVPIKEIKELISDIETTLLVADIANTINTYDTEYNIRQEVKTGTGIVISTQNDSYYLDMNISVVPKQPPDKIKVDVQFFDDPT
jgi:hypothetical protein